jgi:hypothetical protein
MELLFLGRLAKMVARSFQRVMIDDKIVAPPDKPVGGPVWNGCVSVRLDSVRFPTGSVKFLKFKFKQ